MNRSVRKPCLFVMGLAILCVLLVARSANAMNFALLPENILASKEISTKLAASNGGGEFSLQVWPSPLVAALKPGQSNSLELKIRNSGSKIENLRIAPKAFKIGADHQIQLDETTPPEVSGWIRFSENNFTVKPGQTYTQTVTLNVPVDAGFSYSFALAVNRSGPDAATDSGASLKGSVAIFALINIDKPGATRKLEVAKFSTTKNIYEYLPAEFDIEFKNTGNIIAQPAGTVFVQRGRDDQTPINTLAVNSSKAYILPGSTRILQVKWDNGFQVERDVTSPDGNSSKALTWNWNNLGNIRFGKYTAKLVAIYNDGQRDVPIMSEVSFWVIPWKILLGALVVALLVGLGLWSIVAKTVKLVRKIKA